MLSDSYDVSYELLRLCCLSKTKATSMFIKAKNEYLFSCKWVPLKGIMFAKIDFVIVCNLRLINICWNYIIQNQ